LAQRVPERQKASTGPLPSFRRRLILSISGPGKLAAVTGM
jgi:hypothetical protein